MKNVNQNYIENKLLNNNDILKLINEMWNYYWKLNLKTIVKYKFKINKQLNQTILLLTLILITLSFKQIPSICTTVTLLMGVFLKSKNSN